MAEECHNDAFQQPSSIVHIVQYPSTAACIDIENTCVRELYSIPSISVDISRSRPCCNILRSVTHVFFTAKTKLMNSEYVNDAFHHQSLHPSYQRHQPQYGAHRKHVGVTYIVANITAAQSRE